jgi:hypothetical protein
VDLVVLPRPRAGDGKEVEDPAALVVLQDDGERQAQPAGGEQAAEVVREGDVPDEADDGPVRARGDAEGRRRDAVDPVRPPVGEHPQRAVADGHEGLHVADRHGGRDEQRRLGRQGGPELAGDPGLGEVRPERPVDADAAMASACRQPAR